jgi:DNA (cytosine-5)-methyltransferase 1
MRTYKAISLFSGAGGMDIGVIQAGFNILACVESDIHCCETQRINIQRENRRTLVYETDIRIIDPQKLMHLHKLKEGKLDLLFGGPPCQAFSQIGKQLALDDERGLLLFQMVRFAKILRPKAILIEQVKGLLSSRGSTGDKGEVFSLLLCELEALGYVPNWQIINAADYGVAQNRKRVFVVATERPNGFIFPEPTHREAQHSQSLFKLKPYVTVGEALQGLSKPVEKNALNRIDSHIDVTPDGDKKRIRGVPEGSYLAAQKSLPKSQIQGLTKKDTTKFLRLSRDRVSNTLRCGEIFFHPTEERYLTPREYMRIHGYPDDYLLCGPIRGRSGSVRDLDQHRQVANSVPPPVARVLAENIRKVLKCRKSSNYLGSL